MREDRTHQVTLLFDPGTGLEERVLSEQFRYWAGRRQRQAALERQRHGPLAGVSPLRQRPT